MTLDFSAPQIQLPFFEQPLPDEILGSWITRLRMLNPPGVWRDVNRASGILGPLRIAGSKIFDLPRHTSTYLKFCIALGLDIAEVDRDLTTEPFWHAFGFYPSRAGGRYIDERYKQVPEWADRRMPNSQGARSLNALRSRMPRFCCSCIRDDILMSGIPYWHRTHQLPTSVVCAKHQAWLTVACPRCSATPFVSGTDLVVPLASTCRHCGHDFLEDADALSTNAPPAIMLSLAQLGVDVLHSGWSYSAKLFRGTLEGLLKDDSMSFRRLLKESYAFTKVEGLVGAKEPERVPLILLNRISKAGPLEFAAAFNALGYNVIRIEGAIAAASANSQRVYRPVAATWRNGTTQKKVFSLDDAKLYAESIATETPDRLMTFLSRRQGALWRLMIDDPSWLQALLARTFLPSLPSIEQDREVLLRSGAREIPSPDDPGAHAAWQRSVVRDAEWLEGVRGIKAARVVTVRRTRQQFLQQLSALLVEALPQLVSALGRPKPITVALLARAVASTRANVIAAIARSTELQGAIAHANVTYVERLLRWKAIDVRSRGQSLTPIALYQAAGRNYGPEALRLAEVVAHEVFGNPQPPHI